MCTQLLPFRIVLTLPPLFQVRRGHFMPQPQLSFVALHDAVTRRLHGATKDFQFFSRRGCVLICCSPTVCGAPPQGTPHEQNTSALRTLETITEFFAKGIHSRPLLVGAFSSSLPDEIVSSSVPFGSASSSGGAMRLHFRYSVRLKIASLPHTMRRFCSAVCHCERG